MAGDQQIYRTLPIDLLKWAGGSDVFMICQFNEKGQLLNTENLPCTKI